MYRVISLYCLLWIAGIYPAPAQHAKGLPFLRNYTPREYKATPQNLGITQGKLGVFYIANGAGVLEYNGKTWKLHKTPGNAGITCVLAGNNGNVYAGAYNEFGYFEKQPTGEMKYVSLKPNSNEDIGKVVSIHQLNGQIFFQTKKGFYQVQDRKVVFAEAPAALHIAHFCQNTIYIKLREKGLYTFNGKTYNPVPFGETFSNTPIYGVIKLSKGLMVVSDTEIYLAKPGQPFEKVNVPYTNFNSVKLLDGKYLGFGLFGDGLIVTDLDFNIVHQLTIDNGLQDATINDQYLDAEKNLWLGLNRGLAKVEIFSPVTSFGFNQGIKSSIESIREFKNELYISTYNGVYYLGRDARRFEPVANLKVDCYGLNEFIFNNDTMLYAAANSGIYHIANHQAQKLISCMPYNFAQSKYFRNRMFVCNDDGFRAYVYMNGQWSPEKLDLQINSPVITFCEQDAKTVWVSDLNEGVYRLTLQPAMKEKVKLDKFEHNGLPKGFVYVYHYLDKILFGTPDGIYEYDEKTNRFSRSALNPPFNEKFAIHRIAADDKGNLWLSVFYERNAEYDVCFFNGKEWVYQPFQKSGNDIIQCIGFDKDFAYFGSASGLFCYDYSNYINYKTPFNTNIDRVTAVGDLQPIAPANNENLVLRYAQNDLTFGFYATSYTDENATTYSYFLEGYSKKWSPWTTDNQAFFTNLHEGKYTLHIKSKNIFGYTSPEKTFSFKIHAPWYRTWWAYTLYVLFFGAFVYLAILYSTRSLKRIIKERTTEVVAQKEEIEQQKVVLEEKNRDILDSINYARRIQQTIIPSEELLQETLSPELFVFYRPKDIVSGDFYWMRRFNDTILLAVIDCTGHGVPGALVSIVGNNGLNRAVNEFGLRQPAQILDKLSTLTEEAFKLHGKEDLRDGMDITLISLKFNVQSSKLSTHDPTVNFKLANIELEYAGANNPLWIMRNTGNSNIEFVEIKADKQPIGKFEDRHPFTNHTLQLNTGDSIFMFTDGYADQFGGPNGKKFKYKQLLDILMENNQRPFKELGGIMAQVFENWKSNYEQVDDVCLIGIKF